MRLQNEVLVERGLGSPWLQRFLDLFAASGAWLSIAALPALPSMAEPFPDQIRLFCHGQNKKLIFLLKRAKQLGVMCFDLHIFCPACMSCTSPVLEMAQHSPERLGPDSQPI
jgi:hypothetical protein